MVAFYPELCLVQDLQGGKMKATGKIVQGLYIMTDNDHAVNAVENSDVIKESSELWL